MLTSTRVHTVETYYLRQKKIIRDFVKQMSSGLHQEYIKSMRIYKLKDIEFPSPVATSEKRFRTPSSFSNDRNCVSHRILMTKDLLGLISSFSDEDEITIPGFTNAEEISRSVEEITIENVSMGDKNSNQNKNNSAEEIIENVTY